MNNDLISLNNILFEQLERLQDDEAMKDEDKFKKEIERSKAITNLASQVIQNGTLSLKACQFMTDYGYEVKPIMGLVDGKL